MIYRDTKNCKGKLLWVKNLKDVIPMVTEQKKMSFVKKKKKRTIILIRMMSDMKIIRSRSASKKHLCLI